MGPTDISNPPAPLGLLRYLAPVNPRAILACQDGYKVLCRCGLRGEPLRGQVDLGLSDVDADAVAVELFCDGAGGAAAAPGVEDGAVGWAEGADEEFRE